MGDVGEGEGGRRRGSLGERGKEGRGGGDRHIVSLDYGIWRVDRWTESQGGGNNTKGGMRNLEVALGGGMGSKFGKAGRNVRLR